MRLRLFCVYRVGSKHTHNCCSKFAIFYLYSPTRRLGQATDNSAWCVTPVPVPLPIGQAFFFVVPSRRRKVQQGGMRNGSMVSCRCHLILFHWYHFAPMPENIDDLWLSFWNIECVNRNHLFCVCRFLHWRCIPWIWCTVTWSLTTCYGLWLYKG